MLLNDAHCHFFSSGFLERLTKDVPGFPDEGRAAAVAGRLGWDDPAGADALADRWTAELDRHSVSRAALIASIPGDEDSVAAAVRRHPRRFVGFFMFNPLAGGVRPRLDRAFGELGLRCVCLFPAMHRYAIDDERVGEVFEGAAAHKAAVFVHCGVLSVGVRKKLGLPSPFDFRLGDPIAVSAVASRFPHVPVIIPHFGAGFFREALIAADQCPSIHLDSSSSNAWMKYHAGLTLETVFRQALAVVGAQRILFGTDSSFFPRGWVAAVRDSQLSALGAALVGAADRASIVGGNFDRLFPIRLS
jgi:predicted TIM-barrel fold metal-dependent hydrolase